MAATATSDAAESRQATGEFAATATGPLVAGAATLAIAAAIGLLGGDASRFWHAYLLAVMYGLSLGVGGLFFVIAHHLTGGRWGTPVRRLAELTAGTIPISAVLFLPILGLVLSGSDALYPWLDRSIVAADPVLSAKSAYLEPTWFAIRAVAYFAVWILIARLMLGQSLAQDRSDPLARAKRMQFWSGPAMLLFAVSMNFASFDWMMSLEPHWFSTMFGVYFFAGSFVAFMALLIRICSRLQDLGFLTRSVTTEQYHDMGKLLFAFIFFWGYITFSQYMLIWYAAIPEETLWYDIRQQGYWPYIGLTLVFGHLLIPFLGTMSRAVRRDRRRIGFWAAWMLVMHWVDLLYVVAPQGRGSSPLPLPWLEVLCTLGVLGVLVSAWLRAANGKWLLPIQDPRLPIALTYHNH